MTRTSAPALTSFADDVREYLLRTPRQLPSRYLYDPLGSALFDAICELPWYGITRAENRLLAAHRKEILAQFPDLTNIVELGPGDGRKLLKFVEHTSAPLTAHLVDVSSSALSRAAHTLSDAANVRVLTYEVPFEEGLDEISGLDLESPPLVMLLGSNIGNFDPDESLALLRRIRNSLKPGGALLIGADLVKPERTLVTAYDDPLGVSSAFNLNVLLRINRELEGNFDLHGFCHRAVWNPGCSRMEMFAVATSTQRIHIGAVDLTFDLAEGEPIWTETSYKYTPEGLNDRLRLAAFEPAGQWIDDDDAFALSLARTS